MEGLIADTLDAIISRADKEVLVNTVRLIQRQKLSGSKGGWKEFLNSYDRQLGASLSNPSKRSPDVLLAFLKTFSEPRDLMIIGRILRHHTDHKAIDDNFNHFQDEESPQQRLVRLTREHPLYTSHYYFPTHQKEWKVLPIGHISSATTTTKMVAIDCEMVLCEDGTDEVVKICIIDQEMKVKLEKLVKPSKTIVDYRTEITGVSAEDLVGITRSLVEVQESIRKLLKKGTILVGHSLHNDLRALKIEYKRVIDTAYVFKCSDLPAKRTPSLNNLCKAVLGHAVRGEGEPHDCRKDAEAAMKLVIAKLEHGFDQPIEVFKNVSYFERSKLLLHKVPIEMPSKELQKVFPPDVIVDIQTDGRVQGPFYATFAIFKDPSEADKAFQAIDGQECKDKTGRPQKQVTLKNLTTGKLFSFFIRKMIPSPPKNEDLSSIKKRPTCCEENGNSKKPRSCSGPEALESQVSANAESAKSGGCLPEPCEHAREIERLKHMIRMREDEIFNLQKILAALTRKHGL